MSIATELSRIQTDRNTIRAKLVELGMVTNTANLDTIAAAIENVVNCGAVSVTVQEGDTYTIPAGYHNGSGTVSGVAGGGNYSLQSKTATPTKKQQNITPDSGYYGLSDVTVSAIPDAYQDVTSVTAAAGDVLTGKVYVTASGVVTAGSMVNNGAVSKTLDVTTISYTIPKGYHSGSGTVKLVLETKTVTPTKSTQTISPTTGKVLSSVTVNPIPDNYVDTADATAIADNILVGKTAYVGGELVEGTMPDNTVGDGYNQHYTDLKPSDGYKNIPKGYHGGNQYYGVVKVTTSVTPTKETQVLDSATNDKFYSKVTVNPIPDNYIDTSAADAGAGHILAGKKAYVDGALVTGTMANNGSVSASMDGLTTASVTVPAGYTTGGSISLTSDIEDALAAI